MTDGKNILKILDDMIAHNGQDYPIYANEVVVLQMARDALAERDRKLEHIEDVAKAKEKTEIRPLKAVDDSFKKIVVSKSYGKSWTDDDGILRINLIDFLLDEDSLDR